MAFPMAAAGIGATLASGFLTAAGDIFGGKAQQAMYNYQAGLATQRAGIADLNTQMAIQQGGIQSMETGFRGGQEIAHQRVGAAAGNLNVDTGSAARVQASQRYGTQTTESIQQTEAARRGFGFQVEKAQDLSQASAYTAAGQTARTAGEIGAAGSILGTIGGVASKWTQAGLAGVGGEKSPFDLTGTLY